MAALKVSKRSEIGTRKVQKLRKMGDIPGVIYGHGLDTQPVSLKKHDVELAILHGERVLELDVEGEKENVLIKEVQYDTFGHTILHVDLARVSLDERVEITVPIVLRGTPAGAKEGGVLTQTASDVSIECLVTAIPEEIRVSVNDMNINDVIHMTDLELPEGAKLVDDGEAVVCSVAVVAEEAEAPAEAEAEEAAEPEVIGEKPEEGEQPAEAEGKPEK